MTMICGILLWPENCTQASQTKIDGLNRENKNLKYRQAVHVHITWPTNGLGGREVSLPCRRIPKTNL